MEELKEHTNGKLYETYRSEKLLGMGVSQDQTVFKEIKSVSFFALLLVHSALLLSRCRCSTLPYLLVLRRLVLEFPRSLPRFALLTYSPHDSPSAKMAEERALHEGKLQKMEAEMKAVFQQKVNEKEAKLKQSEEELYARHREMKEALEKQRLELEDKKRRLESGQALEPEKVRFSLVPSPIHLLTRSLSRHQQATTKKKGFLRT